MEKRRPSIGNVDRANSTLFKRYLDEQRQSILKTNVHSSFSRPIEKKTQDEFSTKISKTFYPTVQMKKPSSHTNRFLKRFQRQHKNVDSSRSRLNFVPLPLPPPPAPPAAPFRTRTPTPPVPMEEETSPQLSSTIQIEPTTFFIDPNPPELSDEHYAILNDLLNEFSIELTDKLSVDILFELEGSLAQRIYNCVVENDEENDEETNSFSTTTAESSASVVPIAKSPPNHREKYFQPIREVPSPNFDQRPLKSRFSSDLQSILEPTNLLRSLTANSISDETTTRKLFNGFDSNFLSTIKTNVSTQQTFPFVTPHLLLPRADSSAFKPIDSRSFSFQRPLTLIDSSIWFGQNSN